MNLFKFIPKYLVLEVESEKIVSYINATDAVTAKAKFSELGYTNPKHVLLLIVGGQGFYAYD